MMIDYDPTDSKVAYSMIPQWSLMIIQCFKIDHSNQLGMTQVITYMYITQQTKSKRYSEAANSKNH